MTEDRARPVVTQADRDAAWPVRPTWMTDTVATCAAWNRGEYDPLAVITAFARHRTTAEQQAREAERAACILIGRVQLRSVRRTHEAEDCGFNTGVLTAVAAILQRQDNEQ